MMNIFLSLINQADPDHPLTTLRRHEALLEALASQDPEAVEGRVIAHLTEAEAQALRFLAEASAGSSPRGEPGAEEMNR